MNIAPAPSTTAAPPARANIGVEDEEPVSARLPVTFLGVRVGRLLGRGRNLAALLGLRAVLVTGLHDLELVRDVREAGQVLFLAEDESAAEAEAAWPTGAVACTLMRRDMSTSYPGLISSVSPT